MTTRRQFLKACAIAPAVAVVPAVAAEPIGAVAGYPSTAVLNAAWQARVTEVMFNSMALDVAVPLSEKERRDILEGWNESAEWHAREVGLEVVEKVQQYTPPSEARAGFITMRYTLGYIG